MKRWSTDVTSWILALFLNRHQHCIRIRGSLNILKDTCYAFFVSRHRYEFQRRNAAIKAHECPHTCATLVRLTLLGMPEISRELVNLNGNTWRRCLNASVGDPFVFSTCKRPAKRRAKCECTRVWLKRREKEEEEEGTADEEECNKEDGEHGGRWDKRHSGLWAQPLPAAHNYDNSSWVLSLVSPTCRQLLLSVSSYFQAHPLVSLAYCNFYFQPLCTVVRSGEDECAEF